MEPNEIAVEGLGYVPQGRRLFPSLSVHEHLQLFHRNGLGGQKWSPETVYQLFPALQRRIDVSGTSLSGGEQQMLAIGRALVTNPNLLVMDEPSEGLSPVVIKQLNEFINLIKEYTAFLERKHELKVSFHKYLSYLCENSVALSGDCVKHLINLQNYFI